MSPLKGLVVSVEKLSPIVCHKIGERFVCLDIAPGLPPYRGGPYIEGPFAQPREGLGGIPAALYIRGMSPGGSGPSTDSPGEDRSRFGSSRFGR